jgi:hypothetical protein
LKGLTTDYATADFVHQGIFPILFILRRPSIPVGNEHRRDVGKTVLTRQKQLPYSAFYDRCPFFHVNHLYFKP